MCPPLTEHDEKAKYKTNPTQNLSGKFSLEFLNL